jgi:HrpA-like RNA helicase
VWGVRHALLSEVSQHPVVVLVGETGSGKTTLIPQLLLAGGLAGSRCARGAVWRCAALCGAVGRCAARQQ